MEPEEKSTPILDRRTFLNMTGMAAAASMIPAAAHAKEGTVPILPIQNSIAEIIESKTICIEAGKYLGPATEYALNTNGHVVIKKRVIEPNRYIGWPTILKTSQGDLIVAYSGDRDAHVCPYGKTQVITSADNGKTWSKPKTITSTPLDDRDAGLIQTQKGTLLVSWFTSLAFEKPGFEAAYHKYKRIREKIDQETKNKWLGNWIRRSEDGGKSWLAPVRTTVTAPHGPICLANGNLLYIGTSVENGKTCILAERSIDDGKTWKVEAELPQPTDFEVGLSEPHVLQLRSGKIIAMVRNEPKDREKCFLLQSESTDGGKTWSKMRSTGIWGYPPHIIQLKNGWLLVVYGVRKEPYGERACISKDEGKTWDIADEINLSNAPSKDLGYPSSVQLDDESIVTVYYQAPQFAEPTVLMSTHWKLK